MIFDSNICKLNGIEFDEFYVELMEMNIPFRMDIMNRLYNGFNEYGVGWKNRCVVVNGNGYRLMFDCMKSRLVEFKNNNESDRIEIIKNIVKEISLSSYDDEHYSVDDDDDSDNCKYNIQSFKIMNLLNDFENYLKKPSQYIRNESINFQVINKLFELISIDIKHSIVNNYVLYYTSSLCFGSQIWIIPNMMNILRNDVEIINGNCSIELLSMDIQLNHSINIVMIKDLLWCS